MLRFVSKEKGAISVFLVLVMLPMMELSWLMIDGARIHLAQARLNSVADLTFNTALSQYDQTLKDVYGIFAISQDENSLLSNLGSYYERSLQTAGLDAETAGLMSSNIISYLKGKISSGTNAETDYADFLSLEFDSFTKSSKELSAVYNPEILKEQVVEFMKYRAPVGTGVNIIKALKSFSTLSKQTDVIEKKTKYYEEQKSLEENLQKAWGFIEKYKEISEADDEGNDKVEVQLTLLSVSNVANHALEYEKKFTTETFSIGDNKTETVFGALCDYFIPSEIRTDGLNWKTKAEFTYAYDGHDTKYSHRLGSIGNERGLSYVGDSMLGDDDPQNESNGLSPNYVIILDGNTDRYSKVRVNGVEVDLSVREPVQETDNESDSESNNETENEDDEDDEESEPVSTENYDNALSEVKQKKTSTENQLKPYIVWYEGDWGTKNKNGYSNNYFLDYYHSKNPPVNLAHKVIELNKLFDNDYYSRANVLSNYASSLNKLIDEYYKLDSSTQASKKLEFEEMCKFFTQYFQALYHLEVYVDEDNSADPVWWEPVSSSLHGVNKIIHPIKKELNALHNALIKGKKYLEGAKSYLTKASEQLKAGGTIEQSRDAWNSSTSQVEGTELADSSREEIASIKDKFKQSDVQWLINRIEKMEESIDKLTEQVDSYQYAGKHLYDIKGSSDLYKATIESDLFNSKGATAFDKNDAKTLLNTSAWKKITYNWNDQNHIEFNKSTNSLYKYMSTQYAGAKKYIDDEGKDSDDKKNAEKTGKDEKDNKVKQAKDAGNVDSPSGSGTAYKASMSTADGDPSLPSALYSSALSNQQNEMKLAGFDKDKEDASGGTEAANDFFSIIGSKLSNFGEDLRDNLYLSEYIMGMFSYQTLEKEFTFSELKKQGWDVDEKTTLSDKLKLANFGLYTGKDSSMEWDFSGFSGVDGSTINVKSLQDDLKTLTNELIAPKYNAAYLNEVEYIIYGDGGTETVGNLIFGIRFLCNTIAAFMNSEVTNVARTIAWSIFVGPLAFLAPIAQIAITIAFAIGETIVDKKILMAGASVPIMKNKDTWLVSPSGLIKLAVNEVKEDVQEQVEKAIDKAADELDKLINDVDEWTGDKITKVEGKVNEYATELYDSKVGNYIEEAVDHVIKECEEAVNTIGLDDSIDWGDDGNINYTYASNNQTIINKIVSNAQAKINEWKNNSEDGIVGDVKKLVAEKVDTETIKKVVTNKLEMLKEGGDINNAIKNLADIPKTIRDKVTTAIKNETGTLANKVRTYKEEGVREAKDAVKNGKASLKKKLNEGLDGMFGGVEDATSNPSLAAKLLSLNYSGYLRVFLMIQLFTNQNAVLLRMADVIQKNMQLRTSKSQYSLSKSYAYVELDISARVKPLFFSVEGLLNLLDLSDESAIDDAYTIKYHGRRGY